MKPDPRRLPVLLRERLRTSRRARWLAGTLAALLVYTLLGFLLVPALLGHYLPKGVRESLGCELVLGDVRFNPFLLKLEIDAATLTEADGKPVFALAALRTDFQLSSLFRRAWTFSEIALVQPALDFVAEPGGQSNLARIAAYKPADAEPPPAAPADEAVAETPRILVQKLLLSGGRLRYADTTLAAPAEASLENLEFSIEQFGTLPDAPGSFQLAVKLPGEGTLQIDGGVQLASSSARLNLALQGFKPAEAWDFLKEQVRVAAPDGSLDAGASILIDAAGATPHWQVEGLHARLQGLTMTLQNSDARDIELGTLELAGGKIDSASRRVELATLVLRDGHVAAQLDERGIVNWSNVFAPQPTDPAAVAASWTIAIPSISLSGIAVDLRDASRPSPARLAIDALAANGALDLEVGAGQPLFQLKDGGLEVAGVRLASADGAEPLAQLGTLRAEAVQADSSTLRASLARLTLTGLTTGVERRADGTLRELAALLPPEPATPAADAPPDTASDWQIAASEIVLTDADIAISDRQTEPALRYDIKGGDISVRDFDTAASAPLALKAKLPLAQGGEIAFEGSAAPDGSVANLKLDLRELALQPLAPLIAQQTILTLQKGTVSSVTELHYAAAEEPQLTLKGTFGIADLLLDEAVNGEPFLAWKTLKAKGIDLALAPDRLVIEDIRIVEPLAKVLIDRERRMNLTGLMREDSAVPPTTEAELFPVNVERVRISKGTVDFADASLVLPFSAHIERFSGVARQVSTQPSARTTLAFTGRVGTQGGARVEGSLAPFDPASFTDVTVAFRDIQMSTLSPYSATFAGRTITAGDLDLDLEYKVDKGHLAGVNRIGLQDFALGEQVESEQATRLPLDLAIALLSDSSGRIDLEVPVAGELGDPQFSYGGVVWKAVGNVLTGLVTAPFKALGSLLGGGDGKTPDLGSVRFAAGSADLAPREKERIATLGTALVERPELGVTVRPAVDETLDGRALRDAAVRRAVAGRLEVELAADEEPGPIAPDDAKTQRALEQIAEEGKGVEWLEAVATEYAQANNGVAPDRVMGALALIGRGGGDRAFYEVLFQRLVDSEPQTPEGLAALAAERAAVVMKEMEARGFAAGSVALGEHGKPAKKDSKRRTVSIALELGPVSAPIAMTAR